MKEKRNTVIALALNLSVVIMEVVALIIGKIWVNYEFQYYTLDSNIFALIACAIMAVLEMLVLLKKRQAVPKWAFMIKYVASCLLMVTFLVVMFVLAPPDGFAVMLFSGTMLYHHFLCPIIVFISLVFFENTEELTKKDTLFGLLPTIIYAAVLVTLNILNVIKGPYPFLMVCEQLPYVSVMWFVLILGGAYLIAFLIRLIMRAMRKI